jgi:hypothetical protein
MLKLKQFVFNPQHLYVVGLCSIALGLSLSKPLIGIGQGIIGFAWFLEGNYKQRLRAFFSNKIAWVLISFLVVSLVGLVYSSNLSYGILDVKRKLPFWALPFVLFSVKLTKQQLKLIFKVYLAGVLAATFWSIFVKLGGLGITIVDDRDLSRFNSHIRFGLEICLAIFGLGYYLYKEQNRKIQAVLSVVLLWLIAFLFILHLYTGILVLGITSLFLMLFYGFKTKVIKIKVILFLFPIAVVGISGFYINKSMKHFYMSNTVLEEKRYSPYGEKYWHDLNNDDKENGNYVYRNIAKEELEYAWNKVSSIKYRDKDLKGQPIEATLIRFLTSKGEYKNQKVVMNLSPKEIQAIERGISNCNGLTTNAFERRIHGIIWEFDNYKRGRDYNGHSVVMRWVYWKTAFKIFKENPVFGVGTGDIQDAFNKQYEKENSILTEKFRLRTHNQFITAFVTYGIIGGILFFVFLFYPFIALNLKENYLYLAFFLVMLVSMFTEDTLDTQVGLTLYVFFNSLLIFNKEEV